MVASDGLFGRMVLALPHSYLDYPAVEAAAELAERLGVQCVGTFVVEPAIAMLGERCGAQELRSVAAGWQPIARENLERDIAQAAESARRNFAMAVRRRGADGTFRLLHGGSGQTLSSLVDRSDIVAMIEPRHPADRITHQFRDMVHAAFEAPSSVMLVPSRILRRQGPVVGVAASSNDPAVRMAAGIASLMKESLLIINATGAPIAREALPRGELPVRVVALTQKGTPLETRLLEGLSNACERLIVIRRDLLDGSGTRAVADRRGVPVLLAGGDG